MTVWRVAIHISLCRTRWRDKIMPVHGSFVPRDAPTMYIERKIVRYQWWYVEIIAFTFSVQFERLAMTRKIIRTLFIALVFQVVVIGVSVHSSGKCSLLCDCDIWYGLQYASCVGRHLYSIHTGAPSTVQALDLSNNSISILNNYELAVSIYMHTSAFFVHYIQLVFIKRPIYSSRTHSSRLNIDIIKIEYRTW